MSVYEVSVEQAFAARHAVRLPGGQMEPPHEHAWSVAATFRAKELSEPMGAVVDFLEVQKALMAIIAPLTGGNLHEHPAFREGGASAERVAEFFARELTKRLATNAMLYRVSVTEAAGCSAAYYP